MKKFIEVVKNGNRTGLKLSFLCGLNWIFEQLVSWQFYFVEIFAVASFLSVLEEMIDNTIDNTFLLFLLFYYCLSPFLKMLFSGRFSPNGFSLFVRNCLASVIFAVIYDSPVKWVNTVDLIKLVAISYLFYFVMKWLQSKVFSHYLFTNVLNKEYMGVRKLSDELPPVDNFYADAEERDADKRMAIINSKAIQPLYQNFVELRYLKTERTTLKALYRYSYDSDKEPFKERFEDVDTIYHSFFCVYPFGEKVDVYFTLIDLRLSRKDAFTSVGYAKLIG